MNKIKLILIACISVATMAGNNSSTKNKGATNGKKDEAKMNDIFPRGEKIENEYFTGTAYLQWLMRDTENFDCTLGNVTFEPGCRNNWHSHPGGQILMVISGEGYYQERGKPIQLIKKGDVVPIKPNVEHWHGATPDSAMEHLAIGTRTNMGPAVWLEPVSDEDYLNLQQ